MWRLRSPISSSAGSPRTFVVLLLAAGVLGAPASASALTGDNLVVNGDAERPVGSEWSAVRGLGLQSFAYGSTIPANVLIGGGTYDGGTAALVARNAGVNPPDPSDPNATINEQRIALGPEEVEAIQTGTVLARFSAHVGGTTNQADRIGAVADWRDADGQPIGLQSLAPVTNVERGNLSGALFRIDQQAVPAGARSVVVRLEGTREVVPMHNGYVDNLDLRLIGTSPRLEKAFASGPVTSGRPFRLTYTVRNSGDLGAKPAWSFGDLLPEGVRVAPISRATTDCPAPRFTVVDRRISLAGSGLAAGQATCTASIDVVAAAGRYATGPKELDEVGGLRVGSFTSTAVAVEPADPGTDPPDPPEPPVDDIPTELPPIEIPPFVPPPPAPPLPDPPPPPPAPPVDPWLPSFVRPALRASLQVSGSGVRDEGDRVGLRVRVSNPTEGTATRVRACVSLPSALRAEPEATRSVRGKQAKRRGARTRSTTRPCWTVGIVAGDAEWSTTLTVRVVRGTGSTVRPRLTVTSPDVVARATATAKLRTAGEDTDEDADADARRR